MKEWRQYLGIELDEVSAREKVVSAVGGLIALLVVITISRDALGGAGASLLVASMGASAVLLFAVPHGQLSQPWPVLVGHIGSAVIGVACGKLIDDTHLAAACAVGLAIGGMHVAKAIHPPGGATALSAVVGGAAVRSLGWSFVWRPVALNALSIVAVAVAYNALFPWRRYPGHLVKRRRPGGMTPPPASTLTHDDVRRALRELDSFIDVSEDDLVRLHELLTRSHEGRA